MKIRTCVTNGLLYVNNYELVNLHAPFCSKTTETKKKSSEGKLIRSPSEILSDDHCYRFRIKVQETYYAMYRSSINSHVSQGIYLTNDKTSQVFRSRALNQVIIDALNGNLPSFTHIISTIINLVLASYEFDVILTDCPLIKSLELSKKCIDIDWNVIDYPVSNAYTGIMMAIIKGHGHLPLTCIDHNVMKTLNISMTDANISGLSQYKCPLILTQSNRYFVHFVYSYLKNDLNIVGLPVCLFYINRRKT